MLLAAVDAFSRRIAALEADGVQPAQVRTQSSGAASTLGEPTVSVVICTLDRADWLDRALTALAYQRHRAFEVIVVAGPSRDHTPDVLARHAPRIRAVHCPDANLSTSRNHGIRRAGGEIVAFLDDDAAAEPDWLERLCEPYADPAVGGVGGVLRDAAGVDFQCRTMVADRFGGSAEAEPGRPLALDPTGSRPQRFLSLTGANCSFRRTALLEVGGFDEAYAYFLDETDLCLRLVEAGWRLEVAGAAEVHHGYAQSAQRTSDRTPLRLYDPVRSTAYFTLRNGAPEAGLRAAVDRLGGYVEALERDVERRAAQGRIAPDHAERLLDDLETGLHAGVERAFEGARRLMGHGGPGSRSPRGAPVKRPVAERLRLGFLSQQVPDPADAASPCGGIAVWTQALAEALAERGHEVSVFARAADASARVAFERTRLEGGYWLHRYDPTAVTGRTRRTALLAGVPASVARPAMAALAEVSRVAPRRRFDLLMGPLWDLEPAALLDGGAWPVAVSLHTASAQMARYRPEWTDEHRRTHVERVIAGERRLLQRAAHVLSNSRAAARDIGDALGLPELAGRAEVVPHGLPDLAAGVAPRRGAGAGEVDILFVGRLEPRKGVDVLLEAAPRLLATAAHARLTLVGEDVSPPGATPWRERFQARHVGAPWLDRVAFEGPLGRETLLQRYAGCDVVVTPSRYESFGLTALEAMIFAKPCVAARAGGLVEVVEHGVTGLLPPPGDAGALAADLLTLVGRPDLRREMGEAGRRRYERLFTAEAMARAYEGWASEVVTASAARRLAAE